MIVDMIGGLVLFFIMAFVFDISFNLRRINRDLERLLRKLAEITDLLQKKY
jgi:hypothetical protein